MSRKLGARVGIRRLWDLRGLCIALWLALLPACAASTPVRVAQRSGGAGPDSLVILHTNDTHAHLLPFTRLDKSRAGGAAARARLLEHERSSAEWSLVLDAGDVFQGTPLFNFFHGVPDYRAMSAMGYDAGALGNHDLDDGPAAWIRTSREATFPILSANVFAASESSWAGGDTVAASLRKGARWVGGKRVPSGQRLRFLARPYVIRSVAGRRIALFGLMTPDLTHIVEPTRNGGVAVADPIRAARELLPALRAQADLVIALSHMGVGEDRKLALRVPGIDLIIGGHSHTRLDQPILVRNGTSNGWGGTVIVQAGYRGEYLGRLTVYLEGARPTRYTGSLLPVLPSEGEDPGIAALIRPYADSIATAMAVPVFRSPAHVPSTGLRQGETALGNFVADVIREAAGVDVALVNAGGIRAALPSGEITVGDVYTVLPFDNTIVEVTMPGWQLRQLLDFSASRLGKGGFAQVSGVSFAIRGSRAGDIRVDGRTLDSNRLYTVGTDDFLVHGGDGYTQFAKAPETRETGILLREAAVQFLRAHPDYEFRKESRIRWEPTNQALRGLRMR